MLTFTVITHDISKIHWSFFTSVIWRQNILELLHLKLLHPFHFLIRFSDQIRLICTVYELLFKILINTYRLDFIASTSFTLYSNTFDIWIKYGKTRKRNITILGKTGTREGQLGGRGLQKLPITTCTFWILHHSSFKICLCFF
jgi:hypothetical protein